MKIGKKFNELIKSEYFHYVDNYKKYTDFNTLGLYRSILENEQLSLEERIEVRDYANNTFRKTYEFLQLKDPYIYYRLETLGIEQTAGDENQFWYNMRKNQEKILADKKIKHRNFGAYSKHDCGYEHCPYNGMMVRRGSLFAEVQMVFHTDKSKNSKPGKAESIKKQRRNQKAIIRDELDNC